MNSFRRIISVLLGVFLLFVPSVIYFSLKEKVLTEQIVQQETNRLADTIAKQGRVTSWMLHDYYHKISAGNHRYELDIEQEKLVQEPEYRFRTPEEIIAEQNKSYQGGNHYTDRGVVSERPLVDDPEPEHLTMNTETNESVMAGAHNTGPADGHVHTQECYQGHHHSGEPFIRMRHTHTSYCESYIKYCYVRYYCSNCRQEYDDLVSYTFLNPDGSLNYNDWSGNHYGMSRVICTHCFQTIYGIRNENYRVIIDYRCDFNLQAYYGYTNEFLNSIGVSQATNSNHGSLLYENMIDDGQEHEYRFHDYVPDYYYQHNTIQGCHTYHRRKIPWNMRYYEGLIYDYSDRSIVYVVDDMAKNGADAYCAVPEIYVISGGYPFGMSYYTDVRYRIEVTRERTMVFRLQNARVFYGDFILTDPQLYQDVPQTLTADEMSDILRYPIEFLKQYVNDSYIRDKIYNPSTTDPAWWATGTYLICKDKNGAILKDRHWYKSCGYEEEGICRCNEIITGITATHPVQAIYAGDAMLTTLRVTYLDGSQRTVIGTTQFNVRYAGSGQTAIIYYEGKDSPTTRRRFTVQVNITVLARTRTCSYGHTYHLKNDGNDPGCPYCRAWLQSLTVVHPASGKMEIYQGSTLVDNGVVLRAIYYDGHIENVTSGYVDNLDSNYIGMESVTIGYRGLYVQITVQVKRRLKQCELCNKMYELYPDGTDPGCPYCLALTPIFTGNVLTYYEQDETEGIVELVEKEGSYCFSKGDEVRLQVVQSNHTFAEKLMDFLNGPSPVPIRVWVSRKIRDER